MVETTEAHDGKSQEFHHLGTVLRRTGQCPSLSKLSGARGRVRLEEAES